MRAFLFLALLAVAGQVQAAELLVQIETMAANYKIPIQPAPPTIDIAYRLLAGEPPIFQAWSVSPIDVGKTFEVPADMLAATEQKLTDTSDSLFHGFLTYCCGTHEIYPSSGVTINGNGTFGYGLGTGSVTVTRYVPLIGPELYGYQITSITDTLDSFTYTTRTFPHGADTVTAKTTLRIYGDPIPPVPGDFNQDGSADAADYVLYRNRYDTIGALPNGSGNSIVYDYDYAIWRANFGHVSGSLASGLGSQSIPEPATVVSLLLGLLALRRRQWKRCL